MDLIEMIAVERSERLMALEDADLLAAMGHPDYTVQMILDKAAEREIPFEDVLKTFDGGAPVIKALFERLVRLGFYKWDGEYY